MMISIVEAGSALCSAPGVRRPAYHRQPNWRRLRYAAMLLLYSLLVALAGCGGPTTDGSEGVATDIPIVESLDGFEPCSLPTRSATEPVVELPLRERYPCRIVAVPTETEFRSDPAGGYPDPLPGLAGVWRSIAKDSHGRYYTSSREPAILAWNADGTLRGVVGRQGEGPGEFTNRVRAIFVDADDNVHVGDPGDRWLIFSEDLEFLREWQGPTWDPRSVHLLGDNRLLLTGPYSGAPDSVFHLFAEGEGLVSSVGTPRPGRAQHLQRRSRPSHVDDSGLWIAPAGGTGEGYVLEHRTLDGRLERVLQREVPGLPLTGTPDEPSGPEFRILRVDDQGVLWVGVVVQDAKWRPDAVGWELGDFRFEAVSPESGEVLAAVVYDSIPSNDHPPLYPVQGTSREVIGMTTNPSGLATIRIYELHLVRNVE